MIGQSVINVKSGRRGRLSCFAAGVFLLFLIAVLGDWVSIIPMAALIAIMIMVSIGTFSWSSIKNIRHHPRRSSTVMVATVIAVVATHNLAIGVLIGVLLSSLFFASKISQLFRVSSFPASIDQARSGSTSADSHLASSYRGQPSRPPKTHKRSAAPCHLRYAMPHASASRSQHSSWTTVRG